MLVNFLQTALQSVFLSLNLPNLGSMMGAIQMS
ncbi:hypothetical protein C8K36_101763 [Rhodococcus sp. OK519]|nr:hypothetical protein C8K36_101763 [Rhodococcus sp. OK519]